MSTEKISAILDTRMQLGECPIWHPQEAVLYWIDIDGCAVHRFDPVSKVHYHWPLPCEPGCIAINATGGLIVALRSGLELLDTDSGQLSMIAAAPYDPETTRFNDGRCDAAGRLWVGTIYEPRTYPDAALFCIEHGAIRDSGKRATVSNGVAFSPDNKTLYHADTTSHCIHAYEYDVTTGVIGNSRVLKQFSTDKLNNYGGRPDGAAVDSEGAYWCAMYEGGRLLRLSPEGDVLNEITLPVRCPTMMAFGGEDLRTLYITTVRKNRPTEELEQYPLSGCVLSMQVDVPGLAEHAYLP